MSSNTPTTNDTKDQSEHLILADYNKWRVAQGLTPVMPRGTSNDRRARSVYLSDEAMTGLTHLAQRHLKSTSISGLLELLGTGIYDITVSAEFANHTLPKANTP